MAEPDREAYEAAEKLVREAQARAEEAARAAAAATPPNGWGSGATPPSNAFPDLSALLALVDGAARPAPARARPPARRRAARAADRDPRGPRLHDRAPRQPPPQRARGGGHPDPMSLALRRPLRRSCSWPRWRRVALALSLRAALVPEVVLPGRQGRAGQRVGARASSRSSRPRCCWSRSRCCSSSGRARSSGLPPAGRGRRRDHARRRVGGAAARLAAVRQARHPGRGRRRWASSGGSSARCWRRAR